MTDNCPYSEDNVFGPWAGSPCRGGFDFTLLFEQSILTIAPSALFLLASPPRLFSLAKSKTTTLSSRARILKLITAIAFSALQLVLLVLWASDDISRTRVSVPAAALNLLVAVQTFGLSWVEDTRSVRPSSLLNAYLFLTLLLDLAQARTLWLRQTNTAIAAVFSASIAAKAALLFLESRNKRRHLVARYRELPPEATSGILNRSVLWWLNGLFRRGYRALISFDSLWLLDEELTSDRISNKIQRAWERRRIPERRAEFPWAICRALWWPIAQAAIPRIFLILFTFAQPLLISGALYLLSHPRDQTSGVLGQALVGATVLLYIGLAVSRLLYEHRLYRAVTMARGATVSLIYSRALLIRDGLYDEAASITLMSTDTDRVVAVLESLFELWARAIELVVGIYLLARQLGWVCVMPLVVILISLVGSAILSSRIGESSKTWVDAVQKRISLTSSMLSGIKAVKMMGLSRLLTTLVQGERDNETRLLEIYQKRIVWMNVLSNFPIIWAPAITFAAYAIQATASGSSSIGTTQAFTSLALIGLVASPAATLINSIVSTFARVASFDRIQKFLVSPLREDHRYLVMQGSGSPAISRTPSAEEIQLQHLHLKSPGQEAKSESVAVKVDGADIRPAPSADLVLRGISLSIPLGSTAMVVGRVGSGKTTLLRALLGEVVCDRGSIGLSSRRIAYCSQTVWLPNATIRRAICGPFDSSNADEKWYQSTLRACALEHDLALLPSGDQTLIGSGCTVLSGGQKQRVALARAVYSRADILLLDDILSALDGKTKTAVVERLLGKDGLLGQLGSAVILVTHDSGCLSYADKIIVVADGQIDRQGTYQQLMRDGLSDAVHLTSADDADETETAKGAPATDEESRQVSKLEDVSRATGDFAIYKYYFKLTGLWKSVLFFASTALYAFFVQFSSIWLNWWTDAGGGHISLYITVFFVLSLLACVGLWGYIWSILCLIGPSNGRKLHQILLNTVMRAPQSFFSSTDSGTILNRFSQDMSLVVGDLPVGMLMTVSQFFLSIIAAALITTGSTYMAATLPFLIVAVWGLQHVYLKTSRQLRLLDLEAKSPMYSHFLESINGIAIIRAFGWQKQSSDENHKLLDLSQRPYYFLYCVQRWLNLVLDLIVAAEAVIVVGLAFGLRASTSAGLLGVSLNSILTFNRNISQLLTGWTQLETSLGSLMRIRSFEKDVKPEAKEGEDKEPPPTWPDRGNIEFRDVTASHNSTAVAIHNVTLKIGPGQKVGICGRTGSGKSSLIGTLLGLLEVGSGSIVVDGVDLATAPRETTRERLVAIPQDPLVLAGTLRLNVDPTAAHTDAAVAEALERVGLRGVLPAGRGGLDADVAASSLSRGQQQLLALARALLRGGRILLLDEPTSNVDGGTDAVMQRVLGEEFGDCTVLTVAHRLDTIVGSDVVAVMDGGRLVEVGAPAELLRKEGGWFAELARRT